MTRNDKWYNSNRVEARLPRATYIQFGHYMKQKGHLRVSEALKDILSDYLQNYPKTSC